MKNNGAQNKHAWENHRHEVANEKNHYNSTFTTLTTL